MGIVHDEWQAGLGRAMLSKRADGLYAAGIGGVVISICRQVGKTFTIGSIIFALCILFPGMKVLWTAHRTRTSDETFKSLAGFARRKLIAPYMLPARAANGQQEIRFKNGSRILFGARETGFGRGFDDVDVEVFDECQILTQKALDDMVPATNVARNPLLIFMGTPPKPSDPSEMFTNRRSEALEIKQKQESAGLAAVVCDMLYVEVGADEDADPDDRKQWAKGNPSYPHRTTEQAILRMRKILADDESFKREGMGIWDPLDTPEVIDKATWAKVADPASMPVERLTLAIDVPPDRKIASVGFAGQRADGTWHVELDESRNGVDWVIPWIKQRVERNRLHAVVVDEMSGLVERKANRNVLRGTDIQVTLAGAEGRDMGIACAQFFDAVVAPSPTVRHTDQPQVNVALSVARKRPVAGGWAWNRKDAASDITPIVAVTLALWGAQNNNVKRPTKTANRKVVVR
jgi:phage terminase large subunit-like protein